MDDLIATATTSSTSCCGKWQEARRRIKNAHIELQLLLFLLSKILLPLLHPHPHTKHNPHDLS